MRCCECPRWGNRAHCQQRPICFSSRGIGPISGDWQVTLRVLCDGEAVITDASGQKPPYECVSRLHVVHSRYQDAFTGASIASPVRIVEQTLWQQCRLLNFTPTAGSRPWPLCGSPWRQPRNPARHISPKALVLRAECLLERRFFVHHHKEMKKQPE
jgi:hypothetical protein